MPHFPKPFYKKARGCWYIEINRKQYKLGVGTEEQAWEEATRLKERLRCGERVDVQSEALVVLLDEFLEWTKHRRSPETYEWYRYRLELFAKRYPTIRPADLTPQHVDRWVDSYAHLSPGSKRNYIRAVQRALNWAVKQRLIPASPIAYMEKPKAGRRERVVSPAEFADILSLANPAFQDLLWITWETGCRPQESLAVEARHVELANARWVFPSSETKTGFPRFVYLTDKALEITRRRMRLFQTGPLFRNTTGRAWTTDAVNNAFCQIQIRMGKRLMRERGSHVAPRHLTELMAKLQPTKRDHGVVRDKTVAERREEARRKLTNRLAAQLAPKFSLYNLRHTWATHALERGLDGLTVAILMGHQDPSMLAKVYQHLSLNPRHLLEQAKRAVS